MDRYVSSRIDGLTYAEAVAWAEKGWIIKQDRDGYWTAVLLVTAPIQPGQKPWKG